jgi:hypothetical protein
MYDLPRLKLCIGWALECGGSEEKCSDHEPFEAATKRHERLLQWVMEKENSIRVNDCICPN